MLFVGVTPSPNLTIKTSESPHTPVATISRIHRLDLSVFVSIIAFSLYYLVNLDTE